MSNLAWIVLGLISGTIALEIWFAGRRLDIHREQARIELIVTDGDAS